MIGSSITIISETRLTEETNPVTQEGVEGGGGGGGGGGG